MVEELEFLATGRRTSMFQPDVDRHAAAVREALRGRRVAVIGAAGSVGSAVVKQVVRCEPGALALLDVSENNLTELVRDLRSTVGCRVPRDFTSLPIALGSVEFARFFRETAPFDVVFNLSAIKHVRSEKDIYSLIRMIDTNVLFPHEFLGSLPYPLHKFFSVSSDKATNPANLMGASKMVMEEVLRLHSGRHPVSSARFANVAFSDGSLPYGFLRRMEKRQPLSAPVDVRRYFISHEEAGQLCLLSAALGRNQDVFYPKMEEAVHAIPFSEIARRLLELRGYEPVPCDSEEEAKAKAAELVPRRRWPCHFFTSDTTGEKDLEEFFDAGDRRDLERFRTIGVICRDDGGAGASAVEGFVEFAERMKRDPRVTKADVVAAFQKAVPGLAHVETGKNLDQKM
jgi:FlaA1/EpsC-like NDP-sugar epimerase